MLTPVSVSVTWRSVPGELALPPRALPLGQAMNAGFAALINPSGGQQAGHRAASDPPQNKALFKLARWGGGPAVCGLVHACVCVRVCVCVLGVNRVISV